VFHLEDLTAEINHGQTEWMTLKNIVIFLLYIPKLMNLPLLITKFNFSEVGSLLLLLPITGSTNHAMTTVTFKLETLQIK
jgi:hypothetical protein